MHAMQIDTPSGLVTYLESSPRAEIAAVLLLRDSATVVMQPLLWDTQSYSVTPEPSARCLYLIGNTLVFPPYPLFRSRDPICVLLPLHSQLVISSFPPCPSAQYD